MKNISFYLLSLLMAGFLAGCGSPNTPTAVVEGMIKAIAEGDIEAAANYVNPEERSEFLSYLTNLPEEELEEELSLMKELFQGVETRGEEIDGNTAEVQIYHPEEGEDIIDLILIEGQWFVEL